MAEEFLSLLGDLGFQMPEALIADRDEAPDALWQADGQAGGGKQERLKSGARRAAATGAGGTNALRAVSLPLPTPARK